jgi:hypothetical protein
MVVQVENGIPVDCENNMVGGDAVCYVWRTAKTVEK